MGSRIQCFFVEPTDRTRMWLRRYHGGSAAADNCPGNSGSFHNARYPLATLGRAVPTLDGYNDYVPERWLESDPRWPVKCERCDYAFTDSDPKQLFQRLIYRDPVTGQEYVDGEFPAGAMWYTDWRLPIDAGPDGHSLSVMLPGGREWCIDGRANNCTRPDDRIHKCWVRHGAPRTGLVTVDKNGNSCAAGAGSILVDGYHGFLRNGYLEEC